MSHGPDIRSTLVKMLSGENAHLNIETALKDIAPEQAGFSHADLPYTIWQLTEHIRITQWDIVEFSASPGHISPDWPQEYWPKQKGPKDEKEYENSSRSILYDRSRMVKLLQDPKRDLLEPFPYGQGQNLLREAVLIIDHTAYHLGQIVALRRLFGIWE